MRRRRRPIPWAAMRFLIEAYRRQRRRMLFEQWLLLATRCLLVALLALAIGRLVLGELGGPAGPRTLYLAIDNSMTAGVRTDAGETELDAHKQRADELLSALDASGGDRAGLVTAGGPAAEVIVPASSDIDAVRDAIERIEPTDARADWSGALSAIREAAEAERGDTGAEALGCLEVALLSAWRAGSVPDEQSPASLEAEAVRVSTPATGAARNTAVASVDPARSVLLGGGAQPGASAPVRVTLERFGGPGRAGEPIEVTLRARTRDGAVTDLGSRTVEPEGASGSVEVVVPASLDRADAADRRSIVLEAALGPEGAGGSIARDDAARRVVTMRDRFSLGLIAPARLGARSDIASFTQADWFAAAVAPGNEAGMEVTRIEPGAVTGSRLEGLDAAIITRPDLLSAGAWSRLEALARAGGLLVVAPPAAAGSHEWGAALGERLGLGVRLDLSPTTDDQGIAIDADRADSPLLALLRGEFERLAQPVEVTRWLEATLEPGAEPVVSLGTGAPLVIAARFPDAPDAAEPDGSESRAPGRPGGRGLVLVLTAALDPSWTTLPVKPLAVPLVQELVRQGIAQATGATRGRAGEPAPLPPGTRELEPIAMGPVSGADEGSGPRVRVSDQGGLDRPIRRAGVWRALDERGGALGLVTIDADLRAADTSPSEPDAVRAWLEEGLGSIAWLDGQAQTGPDAGTDAGRDEQAGEDGRESLASMGRGLAGWLFGAALALAIIETWLARRASHAETRGGAP